MSAGRSQRLLGVAIVAAAVCALVAVSVRALTSGDTANPRPHPGGGGQTGRVKRAVVRSARQAPFTSLYLVVLLATTGVLAGVSPRTAHSLLLARSTNLDHLAHDPLRVLVSSAFWLS